MDFKTKLIIFIVVAVAAVVLDMVPMFMALTFVWLILKVFGFTIKTIIKLLACIAVALLILKIFT